MRMTVTVMLRDFCLHVPVFFMMVVVMPMVVSVIFVNMPIVVCVSVIFVSMPMVVGVIFMSMPMVVSVIFVSMSMPAMMIVLQQLIEFSRSYYENKLLTLGIIRNLSRDIHRSG